MDTRETARAAVRVAGAAAAALALAVGVAAAAADADDWVGSATGPNSTAFDNCTASGGETQGRRQCGVQGGVRWARVGAHSTDLANIVHIGWIKWGARSKVQYLDEGANREVDASDCGSACLHNAALQVVCGHDRVHMASYVCVAAVHALKHFFHHHTRLGRVPRRPAYVWTGLRSYEACGRGARTHRGGRC
ncbi:hypothetical protein EON67_02915 [archaeon]|nr:MAG: hypothetical protein EON67_02915 [archaeon]